MRSPIFFIEKATKYAQQCEDILHRWQLWATSDSRVPAERELLQKECSLLILKVKLLFSEFDNGQLFVERLDVATEGINSLWNEPDILKLSRETLDLFIEHIKEFRIEETGEH